MSKRKRQFAEEPVHENKTVEYLHLMHALFDTRIDIMISHFQQGYELGFDRNLFAKTKEEVLYKTFLTIFELCFDLHGYKCWEVRSVVHSAIWKRALFSQETFAAQGAALGDPVEHLEALRTALAHDIPAFERGFESEVETKTNVVRSYLGEDAVPGGGVDSATKQRLEIGLLGLLEDVVIEQKALAERGERIINARNHLIRLEYLKPVIGEIEKLRAAK
jgi:hypothetical protein